MTDVRQYVKLTDDKGKIYYVIEKNGRLRYSNKLFRDDKDYLGKVKFNYQTGLILLDDSNFKASQLIDKLQGLKGPVNILVKSQVINKPDFPIQVMEFDKKLYFITMVEKDGKKLLKYHEGSGPSDKNNYLEPVVYNDLMATINFDGHSKKITLDELERLGYNSFDDIRKNYPTRTDSEKLEYDEIIETKSKSGQVIYILMKKRRINGIETSLLTALINKDEESKNSKEITFNYKTGLGEVNLNGKQYQIDFTNNEFDKIQGKDGTIPDQYFSNFSNEDYRGEWVRNNRQENIMNPSKNEIKINDLRGRTYYIKKDGNRWYGRSSFSNNFHKIIYDFSDDTFNFVDDEGRMKTFSRNTMYKQGVNENNTDVVENLMDEPTYSNAVVEDKSGKYEYIITRSKQGYIYATIASDNMPRQMNKKELDQTRIRHLVNLGRNGQYFIFINEEDEKNRSIIYLNQKQIEARGFKPEDFNYTRENSQIQIYNQDKQKNRTYSRQRNFYLEQEKNGNYYNLYRTKSEETAPIKLLFSRDHREVKGVMGRKHAYIVKEDGNLEELKVQFIPSLNSYQFKRMKSTTALFTLTAPAFRGLTHIDDTNRANPNILQTQNPDLELKQYGKNFYIFNNKLYLFTEILDKNDPYYIQGQEKKVYQVKADGSFEQMNLRPSKNPQYSWTLSDPFTGKILKRFKDNEVIWIDDRNKPHYQDEETPLGLTGIKGVRGQTYLISEKYDLNIYGQNGWVYRVFDKTTQRSYIWYKMSDNTFSYGGEYNNKMPKLTDSQARGIERNSKTGYMSSSVPKDLQSFQSYLRGNKAYYPESFKAYSSLYNQDQFNNLTPEDSYDYIYDLYSTAHDSNGERFSDDDIETIYNQIKDVLQKQGKELTKYNIKNNYAQNHLNYYSMIDRKHNEELNKKVDGKLRGDIKGDFKSETLAKIYISEELYKKYKNDMPNANNPFYEDETNNLYDLMESQNKTFKDLTKQNIVNLVENRNYKNNHPELWKTYTDYEKNTKKMNQLELASSKVDVIGLYQDQYPKEIIDYVNDYVIGYLQDNNLPLNALNYKNVYKNNFDELQQAIDNNEDYNGNPIDPQYFSTKNSSSINLIYDELKRIDGNRGLKTDKEYRQMARNMIRDHDEMYMNKGYVKDYWANIMKQDNIDSNEFISEQQLKEQIKKSILEQQSKTTSDEANISKLSDAELNLVVDEEYKKWISNDNNKTANDMTGDTFYKFYQGMSKEDFFRIYSRHLSKQILTPEDYHKEDSKQSPEWNYMDSVLLPFLGVDASDKNKQRIFHYLRYNSRKSGAIDPTMTDSEVRKNIANYVKNNKSVMIDIESINNNTYKGTQDLDKPVPNFPKDVPQDMDTLGLNIPEMPQQFRESTHGSRNIFDMGNTESNQEVTLSIKLLNQRNKTEEISQEKMENGFLELKLPQNKTILAKKGAGILLGKAYIDPRTFMDTSQLTRYLVSQKDLDDILYSFKENQNKTEPLQDYIFRIRHDKYYERWILERENKETNLGFDQWKETQTKGLVGTFMDYTGKILKLGFDAYRGVAFLKVFSRLAKSCLVNFFVKASMEQFKRNTIKLNIANKIIRKNNVFRKTPLDQLPQFNMENSIQLLSSALFKMNRQDLNNKQFDIVTRYIQEELIRSSLRYIPKPEDLENFMKSSFNEVVPQEFLKTDIPIQQQLSEQIPNINFDNENFDIANAKIQITGILENIGQRIGFSQNQIQKILNDYNLIETSGQQGTEDLKKFLQITYKKIIAKWFNHLLQQPLIKTDRGLIGLRGRGDVPNLDIEKNIMKLMSEYYENKAIISNSPKYDTLKKLFSRDYPQPTSIRERNRLNREIHERIKIEFEKFGNRYPIPKTEIDSIYDQSNGYYSRYNELFLNNFYNIVANQERLRRGTETTSYQILQNIINSLEVFEDVDKFLGVRGIFKNVNLADKFFTNINIGGIGLPSATALLLSGLYASEKLNTFLKGFFQDLGGDEIEQQFKDIQDILSNLNEQDFGTFLNITEGQISTYLNSAVKNDTKSIDLFKLVSDKYKDNPIFSQVSNLTNTEKQTRIKNKYNIKEEDRLIKPKLPIDSLFSLMSLSFIRLHILKLKKVFENDEINNYFQINYNIDKRIIDEVERLEDEYQVTKSLSMMISGDKSVIRCIFYGIVLIIFMVQYDNKNKNIKNKNRYYHNFILHYLTQLDKNKYNEEDIKNIYKNLQLFYIGHPKYNSKSEYQIRSFLQTYIDNLIRDYLPREQEIIEIVGGDIVKIFTNSIGLEILDNFQNSESVVDYLLKQYNQSQLEKNIGLLQKFLIMSTNGLVELKLEEYFKVFNSTLELNLMNDIFNSDNIIFNLRSQQHIKIKNDGLLKITGLVFYDAGTLQPIIKQDIQQDLPQEIFQDEEEQGIPTEFNIHSRHIPNYVKNKMSSILESNPDKKLYYNKSGWHVKHDGKNISIDAIGNAGHIENMEHAILMKTVEHGGDIKIDEDEEIDLDDPKNLLPDDDNIEVEIKPDGTPYYSRVVDKSEIKIPKAKGIQKSNKTKIKDEEILEKPNLRFTKEFVDRTLEKQEEKEQDKEIDLDLKELSPQIHDNLEKYFSDVDTDNNRELDRREIKKSPEIKSELNRVKTLAEKLNRGYDSKKEFYIEGSNIYFRGTLGILSKEMRENMENKLINLRNTKSKVHKGLYNQYLKVKEKYGDEIEKYIEDNKNLKLVGHSKGSILALYMANELLRRGRQDFELVLFGTPSIAGDELFQKLIKKQKINNIALDEDFVSKIRSTGYDIIPRNIILKKKGIKINDPKQQFYELNTLADILQNKKFRTQAFDYTTKHSLKVYIDRLKKLL